MIHAVAGAALAALVSSASACTLVVDMPAALSRHRVSALSLRLQHASIQALPRITGGWRFSINNDPSWTTRLDGKAIVGAAFMGSSALSRFVTVDPEPGYTCSDLKRDNAIMLSVTIYDNDRTTTFRLPEAAVQITQDADFDRSRSPGR